jgi:hypothetical protein
MISSVYRFPYVPPLLYLCLSNDTVGKVFLPIFERCKSLILIVVKIVKTAFLGFFYSLNVLVNGRL